MDAAVSTARFFTRICTSLYVKESSPPPNRLAGEWQRFKEEKEQGKHANVQAELIGDSLHSWCFAVREKEGTFMGKVVKLYITVGYNISLKRFC